MFWLSEITDSFPAPQERDLSHSWPPCHPSAEATTSTALLARDKPVEAPPPYQALPIVLQVVVVMPLPQKFMIPSARLLGAQVQAMAMRMEGRMECCDAVGNACYQAGVQHEALGGSRLANRNATERMRPRPGMQERRSQGGGQRGRQDSTASGSETS